MPRYARRRRLLTSSLPIAFIAIFVLPSVAAAEHPDVTAARAAYESTRFEEAIELLARAEASDDLSREELVELFALRALVRYAAGHTDDMRDDMRALASLDPSRILPTTYPPDFRAAFEDVRGEVGDGVSVRIDVDRREASVELAAIPLDDVASLGRVMRLHVRRGAEGAYSLADAARVELPLGEDGVAAWAELVGPGGAVIATRGSAAAPVHVSPDATPDDARSTSILSSPWLWISVGLVLVAGGIALGVGVATSGETQTQLGGPRFVE